MRWITYLLKDGYTEMARIRLPEHEPVSLEPWMIHSIIHRGWTIEALEPEESNVEVHGWADWAGVADSLAVAVRALLDVEWTKRQQRDHEGLRENARSALDDYHVAQMEVGMVTLTAEEPEQGDDDG